MEGLEAKSIQGSPNVDWDGSELCGWKGKSGFCIAVVRNFCFILKAMGKFWRVVSREMT